jgi:cell wall assembly regulator SMI1
VNVVLDFAPGPAGHSGQVLMQVTECDYVVVARSTADLLRRWLGLLDDGLARFDPDYGHAVSSSDMPIAQLLRERA